MELYISILHVNDTNIALTFYQDVLELPVRYTLETYMEFYLIQAMLAFQHAESEDNTKGVGLSLMVYDVDAFVANFHDTNPSFIYSQTNQNFCYPTTSYMYPSTNRVEIATPLAQSLGCDGGNPQEVSRCHPPAAFPNLDIYAQVYDLADQAIKTHKKYTPPPLWEREFRSSQMHI